MENITHTFDRRFDPCKALLIYRRAGDTDRSGFVATVQPDEIYVESYDIGRGGRPVNAHPLTLKEMQSLAQLLAAAQADETHGFRAKGILPAHVLHVQPQGCAIWHTPPFVTDLFFIADLQVPQGQAAVPALLWKATATQLQVFALKSKGRPTAQTRLCHAPFLNIYDNGSVCMGTVDVNLQKQVCLEDLMQAWQRYFFHSYFSHALGCATTRSDTVALWRSLIGSGKPFPVTELLPNGMTLQHLLP